MKRSLPGGPLQQFSLKRLTLSLAVALSMAVLAACGGDEPTVAANPETEAFKDVGVDREAADLVPDEVRRAGKLVIPTAATYPPNEFIAPDGKTIVGMDADLARAISQRLDLVPQLEAKDFESILPGIISGDYKVVLSSITVTPERTKEFDMVTYFQAGTGFFTLNDDPVSLSGLAGLCGFSVAVADRTVQEADAREQSGKCQDAGKPPVTVRAFVNQTEATQSVESGKSDFGMADTPVVSYIVKKSEGRLVKVGEDYGVAPYGVVVNRQSKMAPAVKAALDSLIADGTYMEILTRWGLEDDAIKRPKIEP